MGFKVKRKVALATRSPRLAMSRILDSKEGDKVIVQRLRNLSV